MSATASGPFPDRVVDYISTLDITLRRRLAQFLGVKDQTIRSWARRASVPSGIRALKIHYLMAEAGFTNPEWRCTDTVLETVGRLLAFQVITADYILSKFDDETVDPARIVQLLNGTDHVKPAFREVFERLAGEHSWDFQSARQNWDDLCIRNEHSRVLAELANRITGILPLCEEMVGNEWTAAERAELRKRCGPDVVFRLYNAMGALCGERARQHQLKTAAVSLTTPQS